MERLIHFSIHFYPIDSASEKGNFRLCCKVFPIYPASNTTSTHCHRLHNPVIRLGSRSLLRFFYVHVDRSHWSPVMNWRILYRLEGLIPNSWKLDTNGKTLELSSSLAFKHQYTLQRWASRFFLLETNNNFTIQTHVLAAIIPKFKLFLFQ